MSDPITTHQEETLLPNGTPSEVNQLKRPASVEADESRETKAAKFDTDVIQQVPRLLGQTALTSSTESVISLDAETESVKVNSNEPTPTNTTPAPSADVTATETVTEKAEPTTSDTTTTTTNTTTDEQQPQQQQPQQQQQQQKAEETPQPETTNNNNNGSTIMNIPHGPPPPPGLHLLSDPQQQQLIQNYVQQGHDLANLTATSLAQAMVSPIGVPNLATNLLQQLQQGGNVITALPGPPQLSQTTSSPLHPHNGNASPLSDEGVTKRAGARNMSNDERRQRRLLRNRVAAKECRKKKKQHIHEMEEKIVKLEEENAALVKEVEELKTKLSMGPMQGSESYRLMKEVEELNAKLGLGHLTNNAPALSNAAAAVLNAAQQQQEDKTNTSTTSPNNASPHLSNPEHTQDTNTTTNETNMNPDAVNPSSDGQTAESV